ncbi:hypothetical protein [Actinospica robiniae]|uniref:hypothetical protein n=1 Tax=Actinospica robiniae TaxID=304901 RepID=UPI0004030620|nr:hypothetical protein [Actinospica robiniae]
MRVLIVGRSPSVLLEAVDILRGRGYRADATNQFDDVLTDYDAADLDILVFGGMVPVDTKQFLREEVAKANPAVTFVQGLAGMPGLIAAQVDGVAAAEAVAADASAGTSVVYDSPRRSVLVTLVAAAHVTVEAWWGTSFQPPEPRSAHAVVFDERLLPGEHAIAMPDDVPSVASFAAVRIDGSVHVFTVGEMPTAITRLAPASSSDQRLPPVAAVNTHS